MATRVELFTVTTAAGVLSTAPTFTNVPFAIGDVEGVEIVVPPGPSGLMGFGIMHGGASVFPREESKWIIADGEVIRWDTQNMPTAGDWTIRSYNLDVFEHSIYVRFLVRETAGLQVATVAPLAVEQPEQPMASTEDETQPVSEEVA